MTTFLQIANDQELAGNLTKLLREHFDKKIVNPTFPPNDSIFFLEHQGPVVRNHYACHFADDVFQILHIDAFSSTRKALRQLLNPASTNKTQEAMADIKAVIAESVPDTDTADITKLPQYEMLLDLLTMCNGLPPTPNTRVMYFDPAEWRQKASAEGRIDVEPPAFEALQRQAQAAISDNELQLNISYTQDVLDDVKARVKELTGKTVNPRFPPKHVHCKIVCADPHTGEVKRYICTHVDGGFHVTSDDGSLAIDGQYTTTDSNKHHVLLFPNWHSYGTGGAEHFYQELVLDCLTILNGAPAKSMPHIKVSVDPAEWKEQAERQGNRRWILQAPPSHDSGIAAS